MTRKRIWTDDAVDLLLRLKLENKSWAYIGKVFPCRTLSSCQQAYFRAIGKPRAVKPAPPAPPARFVLQQSNISAQPTGRTMSTARLVVDAELRERIGLQGITAGLLGDPMPGRSALDKKLAGLP